VKRSILGSAVVPAALVLTLALAACGGDDDADDDAVDATDEVVEEATEEATDAAEEATDGAEGGEAVSGTIEIDGSSTVGPLTDAISEEFAAVQPDVTVNLGVSGTGGGFERFCAGETDISNASRPIEDDEVAACEEGGIEYTEVQVGVDALTMVVNPQTDYITCLTTEELIALWGPDGAATWDQVNPEFPADPVQIFAPGTDSGTYDFFNETILEPNDIEEPRQDFNASEDDNIIAQGIIGTPGAWGFFGFAYYQENPDQLTAVEYDAGEGCVAPSVETAQDGSYGLTRPLFIYLKNESLARPEVAEYATFYVATVADVIEDVGYIAETEEDLAEAQATVEEAIASAGG
jgi:phosphate transport system substrate-binding protein